MNSDFFSEVNAELGLHPNGFWGNAFNLEDSELLLDFDHTSERFCKRVLSDYQTIFDDTSFDVSSNHYDYMDIEDAVYYDPIFELFEEPFIIGRKKRAANCFGYNFGTIEESCWYIKFLREEGNARRNTYIDSRRNRYGPFRSHFGMTLELVDKLVDIFWDNGWIENTHRYSSPLQLKLRSQLLILGSLHVLSNATPFRQLETSTNISTSEHLKFFHKFIDKMYSIKYQHIYYPRTEEELKVVTDKYASVNLPGCGGSIDVVHVKWSNCPAGDYNRAKGKETFPSFAFQVITGYNREIFAVSSAQFGSRNDKHITRLDNNVKKICLGWYRNVVWFFYDLDGILQRAIGIYLICDNGYLRWPTLICPIKGSDKTTPEGYFSTNIESVRKDVECVFGILKKRWRILDFGIRFRRILVGEKIFVTCCMLHNMMLSVMDRDTSYRTNPDHVGTGAPNGDDGVWLHGGDDDAPPPSTRTERRLGILWGKRRANLVRHLQYSCSGRRSQWR